MHTSFGKQLAYPSTVAPLRSASSPELGKHMLHVSSNYDEQNVMTQLQCFFTSAKASGASSLSAASLSATSGVSAS